MNAHNMFVDVSVRAVINCSLPLLHGLCIRYYHCLLLMLCRIALFHRTNINVNNERKMLQDDNRLGVNVNLCSPIFQESEHVGPTLI